MFNKAALISRQTTTKWMQVARGPKREAVANANVSQNSSIKLKS